MELSNVQWANQTHEKRPRIHIFVWLCEPMCNEGKQPSRWANLLLSFCIKVFLQPSLRSMFVAMTFTHTKKISSRKNFMWNLIFVMKNTNIYICITEEQSRKREIQCKIWKLVRKIPAKWSRSLSNIFATPLINVFLFCILVLQQVSFDRIFRSKHMPIFGLLNILASKKKKTSFVQQIFLFSKKASTG